MSWNYNDDDDDGVVGTPFAPLEADEIVSRKPEIDQTVRDERGRRRFHGAFTGGFSAGYWNTVGSAEGFTPKIFRSSRVDKMDRGHLDKKPEDYMDEEDFGSFGIAPKKIHTKDDFVENLSFAGLRDTNLSLDEVIRSVFKPTKESIGKRLFKRMRRKAKVNRTNVVFGGGDDAGGEDDLRRPKQHSYVPKNNLHGLGYSGALNPENMLFGERIEKSLRANEAVTATFAGGKRLKISGEAFGIGALEEEDDMGVYSKDDMSQYDFEIGSLPNTQPKPKKKPTDPSRVELEGFRKSRESGHSLFVELKQRFRPPVIPRNWRPKRIGKPVKRSRWDIAKDSESSLKPSESVKPSEQVKLNANVRAVILGEEIVHRVGVARKPAEPEVSKSQLEFQRIQTQQLESASQRAPPKPLSAVLASKFTSSSSSQLDDTTISAGLTSFKEISSISQTQTTQDREEEEAEVDRKPTRTTFEWHPHKLLCKRFEVQNPYPTQPDVVGVVCIGKADRTQNQLVMGRKTTSDNSKKVLFGSLFQDLNSLSSFDPKVDQSQVKQPEPVRPQDSIAEKENQEPEEDEEVEEERKPRPPMDLFKSIFASDEEDDDEEEEEEPEPPKPEEPKKDSRPNGGIFSGINFDELNKSFNPRLDGDSHGAVEAKKKEESEDLNGNKTQENKDDDEDDDEGFYGPALPPANPTTIDLSSSEDDDDSEDSSEEEEHRKSSRKHHHHHRSSSSKKRKKEKKSSSRKSSKKSKSHKHSKKSGKKRKHKESDSEDERVKGQILDLIKKARGQ